MRSSVYVLHYETPRVQFESTQDEKGVVAVNCAEMTGKMIDWRVASSNPCENDKASVELQLMRLSKCQKHWQLVQPDVIVPQPATPRTFPLQNPFAIKTIQFPAHYTAFSRRSASSSGKPSTDSPLRKRKPTAFMLNCLWLWMPLRVLLLNISKSSSSIPVA